MKQGNIIQAYKALQKLTAEPLPIKIACKLHRLKTQMRNAWDFQLEEEGKMLDRLRPSAGTDGKMTFQSEADCAEFKRRLAELADMEVEDLKFDPVEMPLVDGISLSVNDVDALMGFVEFLPDES